MFLSTVEWVNALLYIDATECYTTVRRITPLAYQQHRIILRTECLVKEATYKRIHIIFSY